MADPDKEYSELTRAATDGEGLGSAVLDRIERAVERAREEGEHSRDTRVSFRAKRDPTSGAMTYERNPLPERTYRDAHVIEKRRHGGDRHGEVSFYAVGPVRKTLEEAELDLSAWRMRDA